MWNHAPLEKVAVIAALQSTTVIPLADLEKIEDLDEAQRLQLLVQSVIDYAIYLLSIDGRVLTWNSGAERLKGYRAEEILGRPFSLFYTPEDRGLGKPQKGLEIAARTGRFETEGWRPQGRNSLLGARRN